MFNTIIVETITCPHCRQESQDFEFQSKDTYSVANGFEKYRFPDLISCVNGRYNIEGVCDICNSFIKGKLMIDNQLMKKIFYWVENCPVYILTPHLEESFKNTLKENKVLKEQNYELESALKATLIKIKNNEHISQEALKDFEKIFDFSIDKEKKAVDKTAPSYTYVKGTKKYYIVLSSEKKPKT